VNKRAENPRSFIDWLEHPLLGIYPQRRVCKVRIANQPQNNPSFWKARISLSNPLVLQVRYRLIYSIPSHLSGTHIASEITSWCQDRLQLRGRISAMYLA
jgi:hypothetical protein